MTDCTISITNRAQREDVFAVMCVTMKACLLVRLLQPTRPLKAQLAARDRVRPKIAAMVARLFI